MKILFLESFYGGSHRAVADAIVAHSRHDVELVTLPAHNWKWRIRGAALTLGERIAPTSDYDLVVSGGMITISDLRSFPAFSRSPILLYAHETQLTYPTPDRNEDLHLAFTDVQNIIAATHTSFNSSTHRDSCLVQARALLKRMPRPKPRGVVEQMETRSSVCYPGIDAEFQQNPLRARRSPEDSPIILWNHRWEFDKNPAAFFGALRTLKARGVSFCLAVLGESFQSHPREFETAESEFSREIVTFGFADTREEYRRWLMRADIVVSTAIQENFGLSIAEATASGCIPVLPERLSYPELIPPALHSQILYKTDADLPERLERTVRAIGSGEPWVAEARRRLHRAFSGFHWDQRIEEFDALFEQVARTPGIWK